MNEELFRTLILALVQGLTEFLPVSSSAHLILPAELGAWPDQGLAFDVSVHLGTLAAVLHYFRKTLQDLIGGTLKAAATRELNAEARLSLLLVLSSVPVILAGLLFKDFIDEHLRSARVIAVTTILFGVVLFLADRLSRRQDGLDGMNWQKALIIGLAQMLALIPGTSRSGITMSAALFCHFDRQAASRYSFLLSIPAIGGAGVLLSLDLVDEEAVHWGQLVLGTLVSGVVAWLTIHFFLRWIDRAGFLPFVVYRLLLGAFLFWLVF